MFRRLTDGRYTSLPRGDLAETIFSTVRDDVETLFGETVAAVTDTGGAVDVRLAGGAERTFDVLVGADGLHSEVRQLLWGEEARFARPLGCYVAAFEATGYPRRDPDVYLTHAAPGRSLSRFSLRGDRTLCLLVFDAAFLQGPAPVDTAARKAALREIFAGCGWETPEMLAALKGTDDVYFDAVSQIEVPDWSRGADGAGRRCTGLPVAAGRGRHRPRDDRGLCSRRRDRAGRR